MPISILLDQLISQQAILKLDEPDSVVTGEGQ